MSAVVYLGRVSGRDWTVTLAAMRSRATTARSGRVGSRMLNQEGRGRLCSSVERVYKLLLTSSIKRSRTSKNR